ncbi:MAG: ParA family protein [Candidatus Kerfeldbacteria bacterium]|nr:ParA family protein [Candidatus Kerfeldbacteria bacterium]
MARKISIVNQKGGVGKTTTAINVGAALANHDHKVLIVDLDPQANATSGLGIDYRQVEHGVYEALSGQVPTVDAIRESGRPNIHVLPATQNLAGANVELVTVERREWRLAEALEPVVHRYDYLLVDCPPSLGLLTVNALTAADEVLIPVQCEYLALEGLGQLLETIELVKQNLKPDLNVLGVVMTMFEDDHELSHSVFHEIYKHFPHHIFRVVIPRNVKLAEAPSFGKSIFEHSRDSSGARAYHRLAREIHWTGEAK